MRGLFRQAGRPELLAICCASVCVTPSELLPGALAGASPLPPAKAAASERSRSDLGAGAAVTAAGPAS